MDLGARPGEALRRSSRGQSRIRDGDRGLARLRLDEGREREHGSVDEPGQDRDDDEEAEEGWHAGARERERESYPSRMAAEGKAAAPEHRR